MTLSQFAIAVGAPPKWVQNAAAVLDLELSYSREEACHIGLVRRLHDHLGVPLASASLLAQIALAPDDTASASAVLRSPDRTVWVSVDLARYLSDFSAALVRALTHYEPKRRGRPRERTRTSAAERARAYGLDLGLLDASLRLTPAERLQRLDRNLEFVKALRRGGRRS